jgi:succinate dehydrogenase / fumarate reductase cytochrome b subunit
MKKFVMGLTGLALSGFVLSHMAGNLLLFKSAQAYNMYGHAIVTNPVYPLISWGLVAIMVVHLLCAISLTWENQKARDHQYKMPTQDAKRASLASRSMAATGSLIAFFIVSHILTFKYGAHYDVEYNGVMVRDLHKLILEVFQNPLYVLWYVFSLFLLGAHLKHGFAASFQSIGFSHPRWTAKIRCLSVAYALIVALGFISQPIYVYFFAAR